MLPPFSPAHLTFDQLCLQPRWEVSQLVALPGTCSGLLLQNWGENVRQHWGDTALSHIRASLGEYGTSLPDAPDIKQRYPLYFQIWVTELILSHCLDDDHKELESFVVADAQRRNPPPRRILRLLGPRQLLKRAPQFHRSMYDRVGTMSVETTRHTATLHLQGHSLFAHPIWLLLQGIALRSLFEVTQRELTRLVFERRSPQHTSIVLEWIS